MNPVKILQCHGKGSNNKNDARTESLCTHI